MNPGVRSITEIESRPDNIKTAVTATCVATPKPHLLRTLAELGWRLSHRKNISVLTGPPE